MCPQHGPQDLVLLVGLGRVSKIPVINKTFKRPAASSLLSILNSSSASERIRYKVCVLQSSAALSPFAPKKTVTSSLRVESATIATKQQVYRVKAKRKIQFLKLI
jgi:hypothetical protein